VSSCPVVGRPVPRHLSRSLDKCGDEGRTRADHRRSCGRLGGGGGISPVLAEARRSDLHPRRLPLSLLRRSCDPGSANELVVAPVSGPAPTRTPTRTCAPSIGLAGRKQTTSCPDPKVELGRTPTITQQRACGATPRSPTSGSKRSAGGFSIVRQEIGTGSQSGMARCGSARTSRIRATTSGGSQPSQARGASRLSWAVLRSSISLPHGANAGRRWPGEDEATRGMGFPRCLALYKA
jgi:hypothetical protein